MNIEQIEDKLRELCDEPTSEEVEVTIPDLTEQSLWELLSDPAFIGKKLWYK